MRRYIKRSHLPPTLGSGGQIAVWLLLDRLHAGTAWFVVFWVLAGLSVPFFFYRLWTEKESTPKYEDSTEEIMNMLRRMVRR